MQRLHKDAEHDPADRVIPGELVAEAVREAQDPLPQALEGAGINAEKAIQGEKEWPN